MKENVQQNYQNYQKRERGNKNNDKDIMEDKLLRRNNHSVKTFRTNKKHSISNFDHNNNNKLS